MAKQRPIRIERGGQIVRLNPECSLCHQPTPLHMLSSGVCYDCQTPVTASTPIVLSRSLVNVAAMKSAIKRGEHSAGGL